ncbi:hypothetical protein SOVF_040370 [Spinacia oleracea]|nr:hypothetical protein SOVF_040370 [Spinacia oleracea]
MNAIPDMYHTKMATYNNINIHGTAVTVIVDTQESATNTNTQISKFLSYIQRNNVKVVGVDIKTKSLSTGSVLGRNLLLTLHASNFSLVIQLYNDYIDFPISVYNFIKDNANICFVGPVVLFDKYFHNTSFLSNEGGKAHYPQILWNSLIIEAGELAARFLKKPGLTKSTMEDIVREVGLVKYDGPPSGSGTEVEVDSRNLKVLTEKMVKNTINDAVANYLIGYKLLISTTTVKTEN